MEPKCTNSIKWRGHILVCGRVQHKVGSCRDFEFDVWYSKNRAGKYIVMPRNVAKLPAAKASTRVRVDKEKVELLKDVIEGRVVVLPKRGVKSPYYNVRKHRYIRIEAVVALLKDGFAVIVKNSRGLSVVSVTMKGAQVLHAKKNLLGSKHAKTKTEEREAS